MRPARTEADKAWRRLITAYRHKRLHSPRYHGVPRLYDNQGYWGRLHPGFEAWVKAFGRKPRGQRKQ